MKKLLSIILISILLITGCQKASEPPAAIVRDMEPVTLEASPQIEPETRPVIAEKADEPNLSATNYNAAYVDNAGKLWVWGANPDGMLGTGSDKTVKQPKMIESDVKHVYLVDLTHGEAGSKTHGAMFIIKNNGDMLCSGYNLNGIFGEDFKMNSSQEPKQVLKPLKIMSGIDKMFIEAVSTFPAIFALKDSGELWYWGRGNVTKNGMAQPQKLLDGGIAFVDAELGLSYIATNDAKLYAYYPTGGDVFGDGEDAFIKPENGKPLLSAQYKKDGVIAAKYAAAEYALLQKTDGSLWKFQDAIESKLFDDVADFDIDYPSMHMFALTKYGELYTFEIEDTDNRAKAPVKIAEGIAKARIFRRSIYAISTENELFKYDLGSGNYISICVDVKDMIPANYGLYVFKADGSVCASGDNDAWALGLPEATQYQDFLKLPLE